MRWWRYWCVVGAGLLLMSVDTGSALAQVAPPPGPVPPERQQPSQEPTPPPLFPRPFPSAPLPTPPIPFPEEGPSSILPAPPVGPYGVAPLPLIAFPVAPPFGWYVLPSLTLSGLFDDNLNGTSSARQSDFITRFVPAVALGFTSRRLNLQLGGSSSAEIYAQHSENNQVFSAQQATFGASYLLTAAGLRALT